MKTLLTTAKKFAVIKKTYKIDFSDVVIITSLLFFDVWMYLKQNIMY